MRKFPVALGVPFIAVTAMALVAGCGRGGLDRARPDEFAVARQAPLVIPPDFNLTPPQSGVARPQDAAASQQALDAMFGGPAPRSDAERAAIRQAGESDAGIRSSVADPDTAAVDKGAVTREILASPAGDGQAARVTP